MFTQSAKRPRRTVFKRLAEDEAMSANPISVLVVDDEPYICATLAGSLASANYAVYTASSAEAAQAVFAERRVDVVISDQRMPGMTGTELLEWVKDNHPKTVRLLLTGFAELEDAVDAINRARVFRYLFKPWKTDHLLEVVETAVRTVRLERRNEELVGELRQTNEILETRVADRTKQLRETLAELEQKNQMLEKLALSDPLTALPNRRAMDRLAERELRRRERVPSPLVLGVLDVDHFKAINDTYLLPGGDKVLVDLAKVLLQSQRQTDLLGRIGGEEFMVIAPDTGMDGAVVLGERIRQSVEKAAFHFQGHRIPVRLSAGFAVLEAGDVADYDTLKHLASQALNEAKKAGRNRCVFKTVSTTPAPYEAAG